MSNLVTVALGTGGTVCIATSTPADVIADVAGWYGGVGQNYTPPAAASARQPPHRSGHHVQGVRRRHVGVDAVAVTVNATIDSPTGAGYMTAYPCGNPVPDTSNLNFDTDQTVADQVTVGIGTDRSICFTSTVATNLIVDLSGSFGPTGEQLTTVVPTRLLDTRFGDGGWMGRLGAGQTIDFPAVAGVAAIPTAKHRRRLE